MKLSKKSISVIKLTLWSALVVWMVFFFAFGVIAAQWLASYGPEIYSGFGSEVFARVLHWIAPVWVVFTALLTCVAVARFANRRLRPKRSEARRELIKLVRVLDEKIIEELVSTAKAKVDEEEKR